VVAGSVVRELTAAEVRQRLLHGLGVRTGRGPLSGVAPQSVATQHSAFAAIVRAVLWADWTSTQEAVHVGRVLNAASRLASPLLGDVGAETPSGDGATEFGDAWGQPADSGNVRQLLRAALEDLEVLGDVAEVRGGRWLPAPLRCVALDAAGAWLLVGGRPTSEMPRASRAAIRANGTTRILAQTPSSVGLDLPAQPLDDWSRIPKESLAEWTKGVLDSADLVDFEGDLAVEAYMPSARGQRQPMPFQYDRWSAKLQALPEGRYLIRTRHRFGPMRYAVASLKRGSIIATGAIDLPPGELRRLLYGLDAQAEAPTVVRVSRHGSGWRLMLRNALPRGEERLLTALGDLRPSEDGRYYPRVWDLEGAFFSTVCDALERLKVVVDVQRAAVANGS
jgi:hypothetical protein